MAVKFLVGSFVKAQSELQKSGFNLLELLPLVLREEFESLTPQQTEIALKKATRGLLKLIAFDGLETWFNNQELVVEFEPITVGFGVVIKPKTVRDAVQVFRNTTLNLHRQAMIDAICDVVQNFSFANLDEKFFIEHFDWLRLHCAGTTFLDEKVLIFYVFVPLFRRISNLLITSDLAPETFSPNLSVADVSLLKEIFSLSEKSSLADEELNQLKVFLVSTAPFSTAMLDFVLYKRLYTS